MKMEVINWALYDFYNGKYIGIAKSLEIAESIVDVNKQLGNYLESRPIISDHYNQLKKQIEKDLIDNLPRGILN